MSSIWWLVIYTFGLFVCSESIDQAIKALGIYRYSRSVTADPANFTHTCTPCEDGDCPTAKFISAIRITHGQVRQEAYLAVLAVVLMVVFSGLIFTILTSRLA